MKINMMKNRMLGVFLIFFSFISSGQTIYSVSFIDTDDDIIGDGCTVDNRNFQRYINRIKDALNYKLVNLSYIGDEFNKRNFDGFINKINSEENDLIFLYVSCHGARSAYDKTKFPQVKLKNTLCSVYDKYDALKKLPHKTLITLIDACNVIRGITPKEVSLFPKTYEPTPEVKTGNIEIENCRKVFVENNFDLIITSSQVGVTSITTSRGSIFTNNFVSSTNYYLAGDPSLALIDNIITRSYDYTYNETERIYINNKIPMTLEERPHHPEWELSKRNVNAVLRKDYRSKDFDIAYTSKKRSWIRRLFTNNDFTVVMRITAVDPSLMAKIKNVRYILHHTFDYPVVDATNAAHNYKYTLGVWGEFLLRAEITLNDNTVVDVAKELELNGCADCGK